MIDRPSQVFISHRCHLRLGECELPETGPGGGAGGGAQAGGEEGGETQLETPGDAHNLIMVIVMMMMMRCNER